MVGVRVMTRVEFRWVWAVWEGWVVQLCAGGYLRCDDFCLAKLRRVDEYGDSFGAMCQRDCRLQKAPLEAVTHA